MNQEVHRYYLKKKKKRVEMQEGKIVPLVTSANGVA
jgi:hypothetical protein